MPEGPTVVVSVVGNVLRAKESGLLALVKEEFPGAVFHQNPEVRLGYHAPSEVISSAIKEGATHVLVAERYTDDGGVIRNLQPLAEAAQAAAERSGGKFVLPVLVPVKRDGREVLARLAHCGGHGWHIRVLRERGDERPPSLDD